MIVMNINKLPFLYDYWKKDNYAPLYVCMYVYQWLVKYLGTFKEILHFTDNSKHTHKEKIQSTTGSGR